MVEVDIKCQLAVETLKSLNGQAQLIYIDPPYYTGRDFGEFDDRWPSLEHYLYDIKQITYCARRALNDTGVFVVHCDHHAAAEIKAGPLNEVFGRENMVNNLVWCYQSGGASKRRFSRKHDDLWVFAKTKDYKFNPQREPYPHEYKGDAFHPDGRLMNDWWQIPFIATSAKERTGYPTQKPLALLSRLIEAFTDPGDLVVDPVCGSGTTGVAAVNLGRSILLGDKNEEACLIANDRINKTQGSLLAD